MKKIITFKFILITFLLGITPKLIAQCSISDFIAEVWACNADGTFNVDLDFNYANVGGIGFDIFVNGTFHSFQTTYPDTFITLHNFANGEGQTIDITVSDNDNPDCHAAYTIIAPNCSAADCSINEVAVTTLDCNEATGNFAVQINANYSGTGDTFTLQGNGMNYGTFTYTNLPIIIDGLPADGSTIYEFVLIDNLHDGCSNWTALNAPISCTTTCHITEVFAEAWECNGDGLFAIDLTFDITNGLGAGFELWVDGVFHSYHPNYPETYLTINNIAAGTGEPVVLTVQDNDNPACHAVYTIISPNCSTTACSINEVAVTTLDCNEATGNFAVQINANYSGTGDTFTLQGNGMNYGTFTYTNLPIIIDGLPADGSTIYEFVLIDNLHDGCSNWTALNAPISCTTTCHITEVFAEAWECNGDGLFAIDLTFDITNGLGAGFELWVDGVFHSYHPNYPETYLTINNVATGTGEPVVLTVQDNDNPGCHAVYTIISPNCSPPPCSITNTSIVHSDCNADGQVNLILDFDYGEGNSGGFILGGNGNGASYTYADLPITLGSYTADGSSLVFEIIDNDIDGCFDGISITLPTCTSGCHIWDVTLEPYNCGSDGLYDVAIDFNYSGVSGVGFDVFANGIVVGFYNYSDLPVTLTNIGLGNGEPVTLMVSENDDLSCFGIATFLAPHCIGDCAIWEVNVDATACNGDGNFMAVLNFNHENTASDWFTVQGNGTNYGTFSYADVPIQIGPLAGNGSTIYEFVVIDNDNNSCSNWTAFDAPINCSSPTCTINNIVLEAYNCNADGWYTLHLDFDYEGVANSFFEIYVGDTFYDYYLFSELPLTLHEFGVGEGQAVTISISENDNPDCTSASHTFEAPFCDGGMSVSMRTMLEAPYDASTGTMNTALRVAGLVPTSQPFNTAPWLYNGTESVANVYNLPLNMVDWVLVALHDATNNETIIAQRAAILLDNGDIADLDGTTGIDFTGIAPGNYYLVVRSRTHIAVMSSTAVSLPNAVAHDFTQAANILGGAAQLVALNTGVMAQVAGDFNSDGIINVFDFNFYANEAASINTYTDGDANLDGVVSTADFNVYRPNMSKIGVPQIRY